MLHWLLPRTAPSRGEFTKVGNWCETTHIRQHVRGRRFSVFGLDLGRGHTAWKGRLEDGDKKKCRHRPVLGKWISFPNRDNLASQLMIGYFEEFCRTGLPAWDRFLTICRAHQTLSTIDLTIFSVLLCILGATVSLRFFLIVPNNKLCGHRHPNSYGVRLKSFTANSYVCTTSLWYSHC